MKQTIGEIIKSMFVGSESTASNNVIDMLKADHRKVEGLFKAFENSQSYEERGHLIDEIVKEISIHATVEERLVYPELEGEGEKTKEALEEHHAVKMMLAELAEMNGSEDTAAAKVKVISEMVKHHIQEEELDLLPKLKNSVEDLEALGRRFAEKKEMLSQNYKPPSKKEELQIISEETTTTEQTGEKEVIFNFAPDHELALERLDPPGLPELANTNPTIEEKETEKTSVHRKSNTRKKGTLRKKTSHVKAARTARSKKPSLDSSSKPASSDPASSDSTEDKTGKKSVKKAAAKKATNKSPAAKSGGESTKNEAKSSGKTASKKAASKQTSRKSTKAKATNKKVASKAASRSTSKESASRKARTSKATKRKSSSAGLKKAS